MPTQPDADMPNQRVAEHRTFWLGGLFYNQSRVGNPANPSDQSLPGQ